MDVFVVPKKKTQNKKTASFRGDNACALSYSQVRGA